MKNKEKKPRFDEYSFVFFIIVILLLPIILTQTTLTIFDFSNSGQIGDTIGGITAPFVGLLSAYLIYRAFLVQVEANKIQSKNNEFSIALKLIDDLEARLNDENNRYEYTYGEGKTNKVDRAKFYEIVRFWNGMIVYRKHYTGMIVLIIKQVNYFKKFVDGSQNLTSSDKSLLFEKASLTFGSKLYDAFEILLMIETSGVKEEEKQFYLYCKRFFNTTLQDLSFYLIDINEFDDSD